MRYEKKSNFHGPSGIRTTNFKHIDWLIDWLENKGQNVLANKAYILSLKMLYLSFVHIKNIKVCQDEMCRLCMNGQNNINIKKMFKKPIPLILRMITNTT